MEVKTKFQLFLTGECQTFLGYFGFKKGQKRLPIFGQIWSNFGLKKVIFCLQRTVTFGHSSVIKSRTL